MSTSAGLQQPTRFDNPLDPDLSWQDVDRILKMPPFDRVDRKQFRAGQSLRDIVKNDTRLVRFSRGDLVVRQGDYGSSAFVLLSGRVRVVPGATHNQALLGRRSRKKKSVWQAFSQLWRNRDVPEYRDLQTRANAPVTRVSTSKDVRVYLPDVERFMQENDTIPLGAGQIFGEIAAISRTPRTATIFCEEDAELLEIRWQGLRDIRKRDRGLRKHIDHLYRERSLKSHLVENRLFANLADVELEEVVKATRFESYGDFDWSPNYKMLASSDPDKRLDHEPVVAEEGDYVNGLVLIRAGFARMSVKFNHGHRTISYLGPGATFGLREILHNWNNQQKVPLQRTLRAVGNVDILWVPSHLIEKYVLPQLKPENMPEPIQVYEDKRDFWRNVEKSAALSEGMMEFVVSNRFNNGSAAMLINLERCTGCDDCVRACAAAHDNNPRFIRHGKRFGNLEVANACMHCLDPVCMIGCPTGAIHRSSVGGQVVINDETCIGCTSCANNCPYDNIRMVEIRDGEGSPVYAEGSNLPILQATKCDLCQDQVTGPACQYACPHEALVRVDMGNPNSIANWLKL